MARILYKYYPMCIGWAFLAFFLMVLPVAAQEAKIPNTLIENTRTTSQTKTWNQLIQKKEFGYQHLNEGVVIQRKQPSSDYGFLTRLLSWLYRANVLTLLLWGSIVSLIIYILYLALKGMNLRVFTPKADGYEATAPITTPSFFETPWEQKMQQALATQQYNLAIRYGFLHLLQQLEKHHKITYREDKTNYEYYKELASTALHTHFKAISMHYEWVFYGHFESSALDFQSYKQKIDQLLLQLHQS